MVTKNSLVNCMLLSFVFHSAVCIQKWIRGILQTGLQVPEAAQWSHPTLNFFPHWYFFSIVARWFLYFKLSQLKSCRKAVNGKKKKKLMKFPSDILPFSFNKEYPHLEQILFSKAHTEILFINKRNWITCRKLEEIVINIVGGIGCNIKSLLFFYVQTIDLFSFIYLLFVF